MKLKILKDKYAVVKLPTNYVVPDYVLKLDFFNLVRTSDELSLIIKENITFNYKEFNYEDNWKIFRFVDILNFNLNGILDGVINPLSNNDISIFSFSTYNTDYVMFKSYDETKVVNILNKNNYEFVE